MSTICKQLFVMGDIDTEAKHYGNRCVAFGCGNTNKNGVSIHNFPHKRPTILKQWVEFVQMKRDRWNGPTRYSVLCSEHFTNDCYPMKYKILESLGQRPQKKLLLPEAIPTIHADAATETPVAKRPRMGFTKRENHWNPVPNFHTYCASLDDCTKPVNVSEVKNRSRKIGVEVGICPYVCCEGIQCDLIHMPEEKLDNTTPRNEPHASSPVPQYELDITPSNTEEDGTCNASMYKPSLSSDLSNSFTSDTKNVMNQMDAIKQEVDCQQEVDQDYYVTVEEQHTSEIKEEDQGQITEWERMLEKEINERSGCRAVIKQEVDSQQDDQDHYVTDKKLHSTEIKLEKLDEEQGKITEQQRVLEVEKMESNEQSGYRVVIKQEVDSQDDDQDYHIMVEEQHSSEIKWEDLEEDQGQITEQQRVLEVEKIENNEQSGCRAVIKQEVDDQQDDDQDYHIMVEEQYSSEIKLAQLDEDQGQITKQQRVLEVEKIENDEQSGYRVVIKQEVDSQDDDQDYHIVVEEGHSSEIKWEALEEDQGQITEQQRVLEVEKIESNEQSGCRAVIKQDVDSQQDDQDHYITNKNLHSTEINLEKLDENQGLITEQQRVLEVEKIENNEQSGYRVVIKQEVDYQQDDNQDYHNMVEERHSFEIKLAELEEDQGQITEQQRVLEVEKIENNEQSGCRVVIKQEVDGQQGDDQDYHIMVEEQHSSEIKLEELEEDQGQITEQQRVLEVEKIENIKAGSMPSYKCDLCSKEFFVLSQLLTHFRTHTGYKPYECNVCNNIFSQSSDLQTHLRTHTRDKPYEFHVCNEASGQSNHLQIPLGTHKGNKLYKCDVCGKAFSRSGTLHRHKRVHTGDKPYKCDVCGKVFSQLHSLQTHLRTHTGDKPYKCDVCGKAFNQSYTLQTHHWTHTGDKPYKCDICGKEFRQSSTLRMHLLIHTGNRPYKCDICCETFSHSSTLQTHLRTHRGDGPYKCNVCGKGFSQLGNLRRHIMIHTGDKPYKCDICSKTFNQSGYLQKHLKIHK